MAQRHREATMDFRLGHSHHDFFIRTALELAAIDSRSVEKYLGRKSPTSPGQTRVQNLVATRLAEMGVTAYVDTYGCMIGEIPASAPGMPSIGLGYHPDTSHEGADPNRRGHVRPRLILYNGGDIALRDRTAIRVVDNPHLVQLVGQDILVGNGTCSPGWDNKAGAGICLAVARFLADNPKVPHGRVVFFGSPDEEIGGQARHLNIPQLGLDCAVTVDGGALGELSWETFHAAKATVTITGYGPHPGEGKEKGLVNALQMLARLISFVEENAELPERTDKRQPFIMPVGMPTGDYTHASVAFILRGFKITDLTRLEGVLRGICMRVMNHYPRGNGVGIEVKVEPSYPNMVDFLPGNEWVVDCLKDAYHAAGVEVIEKPIRGGTDGSSMSKRGLFTPNVWSGAMNMHALTEHLPVSWALKAVVMLLHFLSTVKKS